MTRKKRGKVLARIIKGKAEKKSAQPRRKSQWKTETEIPKKLWNQKLDKTREKRAGPTRAASKGAGKKLITKNGGVREKTNQNANRAGDCRQRR